MKTRQPQELKKRNIRLALMLAGFALFVLATSFPFWQAVLVELAKAGG